MKIYVDADACPTAVKDILIRAGERLNIEIFFVANQPVKIPVSNILHMITIEAGPDIADDKIVELVKSNDLVISEDIPLSDRVIEKGAFVITTHGEVFTKDNIKGRLVTRNLLSDLRSVGVETGGPSAFTQRDIRNFANELDKFLSRR